MSPIRHLSPAEAARRLGVSVRALRLYERRGLVHPHRTGAGWRVYGPAEIARLHQVLTLKSFGLPLARIARLLEGREASLDEVLALQEAALADRAAELSQALATVRAARARLTQGPLSLDELSRLTKETTVTTQPSRDVWNRLIEPLYRERLTPAQFETMSAGADARLRSLGLTRETLDPAWGDLLARLEALMARDETGTPDAADAVRRWFELAGVFTKADPTIETAVNQALFEALADPLAAGELPFGTEVAAFATKVAYRQRLDPSGGSSSPRVFAAAERPRVPEATVRHLVGDVRNGRFSEGLLGPGWLSTTESLLGALRTVFVAFGALKAIRFEGLDGALDAYRVFFDQADVLCELGLDDAGRIETLTVTPT